MASHSSNQRLHDWVRHWADIFKPSAIYWCDGSSEEYDRLSQEMVDAGTFQRLAEDKRPNSYLALSDPADVARVEDRTFIATTDPADAGPTNNWRAPDELRREMLALYDGCMRGRTM